MDLQTAEPTHAVHVGRQPIVDRDGQVIGYELLFRAALDHEIATSRGAFATSQVLVTACTEFGLGRLGGGRPLFINVTREFLIGELPLPFAPDEAVLEVLETVRVDREVLDGLRDLVARGYAIAIDDYLPGTDADQLIEFATYIKFDILDMRPEELERAVRDLELRPGQHLVAERVETAADFAHAESLGFTLFQGYLFARPQTVSSWRAGPDRQNTLALLALLAAPTFAVDEFATTVNNDPTLAHRLMIIANGVVRNLGAPAAFTNVADAAEAVGPDRVRQWLSLMAIADLAGDEQRADKVLVHARFCYEIAVAYEVSAAGAYLVGLLDGVCELTGEARNALTRDLPLTTEIAAALTTREGPLGRVLALATAYQRRPELDVDTSQADLSKAYLRAVAWASDVANSAGA